MQRQIFHQQLLLAAKYRRPVSIHCVNQHGVLLDILNSLLKQSDGDDTNNHNYNSSNNTNNNGEHHPIPPAMALHSYTGTAHHVQAMLQWEKQVRAYQNKSTSNITDPLIYFGFSHCVNYMMCTSTKSKRQGIETLRSIPRNRLLVESDVHCSDFVPLGAAGTIAYMAHVLNDSLENIATLTTQNGLRYFATIQNVS
jgi:TatD DNase family protein